MSIYSVYETATGRLTGAQVSAPAGELIAAAIPDGCAVVLGAWDYLSHAVIHATGEVVPIPPPEPDWRERKGVAASAAYAEIVAAEAQQARPIREILDALVSGLTLPEDAMSRFTAIKTRIEAARLKYQLILATETEADLSQIES